MEKRIAAIPVKNYHWTLYLQLLVDSSQSKLAVKEANNGINCSGGGRGGLKGLDPPNCTPKGAEPLQNNL